MVVQLAARVSEVTQQQKAEFLCTQLLALISKQHMTQLQPRHL